MKNQHFAVLESTGLTIRFASQRQGVSRVYLGDMFEEFMGNKNRAMVLHQKASSAGYGTHLGDAIARLAARSHEARKAMAEDETAQLCAARL